MRFPVFIFVFPITILGCASDPTEEAADLVLRNGRIVTLDDALPEVTALAARMGLFVAVGSDDEIEAYIQDETWVIDLEGMLAVQRRRFARRGSPVPSSAAR